MLTINKYLKLNKGFTLLELMIVIGIITILAATSIVVFNPIEKQKEQRDALRVSTLSQLSSTLELYYSENKKYPLELGDLTDPNSGIKGLKVSFEDPISQCNFVYVVSSSTSNPSWYRIYALKESQNFTIPKGQGLISEIDGGILTDIDLGNSEDGCIYTNVFTISGGEIPSN